MKKITLTIGIPVHNEAANIKFLLTSILHQKNVRYSLEEIIVMCDGTTDETDKIAKQFSMKNEKIKVIVDGQQKGKLKRLMELYKMNKSQLIAIFDGDVVLGTPKVLDNMVSKFINKKTAIIGANNQPIPTKTFVGKLINTWSDVWYHVRKIYKNGDNVHSIRGCCMMLEREFAKCITFPKGLISESQFIFFLGKKMKRHFIFAEAAIVYYIKPTTLSDYFSQKNRVSPNDLKLEQIFGTWVLDLYKIPASYKIKALLYKLAHDPLFTLLSGIFIYSSMLIPSHQKYTDKKGVWKRVGSTKKAIDMIIF
ncbi:MAG TPA: glycosyltransferase [Candidatus Eisenbacteria bacterium]|nr:glycosyltransferase [Candidatus Eisenbacteria bacterium]